MQVSIKKQYNFYINKSDEKNKYFNCIKLFLKFAKIDLRIFKLNYCITNT